MSHPGILVLLVVVASASTVWADKNVSLAPRFTSAGSPAVFEKFDSPLAAPLSAAKGDWKVVEGVLIGQELAADKHAAVLNYQKKNHNSVVRFSFKLDGSTQGFNLSLNHKKSHLFRVVVTPSSMSLQLDKNKKDPASQAIVLATAKGKFEQRQWYTIQVEMLGDRVAAQSDNGLLAEASHPRLDVDKPNYRFVMKGNSLTIDDLQISELK